MKPGVVPSPGRSIHDETDTGPEHVAEKFVHNSAAIPIRIGCGDIATGTSSFASSVSSVFLDFVVFFIAVKHASVKITNSSDEFQVGKGCFAPI
jgi:hypothetical protein